MAGTAATMNESGGGSRRTALITGASAGIGTALAVFLIWNTVFFIVFQNAALGVQLHRGGPAHQ